VEPARPFGARGLRHGSSYGVGRGICEVLGQCGATAYLTGRSTRMRPGQPPRWAVEDSAQLVTAAGGRAVPVVTDHTSDDQVRSLFDRVRADHGSLDLIVSTQERPGDDEHFGQNIVVDSAAIAMQRMVRYLARELSAKKIAALLVYLGWVNPVTTPHRQSHRRARR
jgi:NAD(P)-dependent dehydrogenase (short-subunit alcohol dehydrogenase family)